MPHRYIENTISAVVVFLIMGYVSSLIPFPSDLRFLAVLIGCLVATPIYFTILLFYLKARDRRFINKEYEHIRQNDYDAVLILLDKAIKRQPRLLWLQIERAIVFGYEGDLNNFYRIYESVHGQKTFEKAFNHLNLMILRDVIMLLQDNLATVSFADLKEENVEKNSWPAFFQLYHIMQSYIAADYYDAIKRAEKLVSARIDIFKFFASFVLFRSYEALRDGENALIYKKEYLSNPLAGKFQEFETRID